MRIAVVNDLRVATEALRRLLDAQPDCDLAWTAADGAEAVERCRKDRPDLVLMDLVMPGMDGVEATRRIMRESPCPILVVTATVDGNAGRVYAALGAGALDAVNCPTFAAGGGLLGGEAVLKKIRTLERLLRPGVTSAAGAAAGEPPVATGARRDALIALGSSTGGPDAVAAVLNGASKEMDAPVVVVQHLDPDFVPGFVSWLATETRRRVRAVADGDRPERGTVHLASTDDHLVVDRGGAFRYRIDPADLPYRPSVDVFFTSAAEAWGRAGVAVVLTGMGRDGAEGLLRLKRAGWTTIAQDEATSVVPGMPRAASAAGGAGAVLPLPAIGAAAEAAWRRLDRGEAR